MDSLKENFHHANLIIGGDQALGEVFSFVESLGVKIHGNENFVLSKFDKFLIDDAREVFNAHLRKTPEGELQIFILYFNYITTESQNALLKMFEEPKDRTHFFIVAPSKNLFLETIISRVNIIENIAVCRLPSAVSFLNMNIGERIKFIADLTKDIKNEKAVKQDAIDLLSGLEVELEKTVSRQLSAVSLKKIIEAKKYINLNGASVKILLENVALSV